MPVSYWSPTMFAPAWSVVPLEKYSATALLLFGSSNFRWPNCTDRLLTARLLTVQAWVAVRLKLSRSSAMPADSSTTAPTRKLSCR